MLRYLVLFFLIYTAPEAKKKEKFELKEWHPLYLWEWSPDNLKFLYSFRFILAHRNDLSIIPDPANGYIGDGVNLTNCIDSIYVKESYDNTNLGQTTLGCAYILGWFR